MADTSEDRSGRGSAAGRWWFGAALVAAASVQPFAGYLAHNRRELEDVGLVLVWAAGTVAVALVLFAAGVAARLDRERLGVALAAAVWWFFSFDLLFQPRIEASRRLVQLAVWAFALLLLGAVGYRFGRFAVVRNLLLAYLVVLTVVNVAVFASYRMDLGDDATELAAPPEGAADEELARRPNVYYFLFDEYGRPDQLAANFGWDGAPHQAALEDRGFDVLERAFGSYPTTLLSLSSVLTMDYVATPEDQPEQGLLGFTDIVPGNNATVSWLRAHGYAYAYMSTEAYSWGSCDEEITELCVDPPHRGWAPSEVTASLLDLTPVGSLGLTGRAVGEPMAMVDAVAEADLEEPFVAVGHILSPHGPHRYREDCSWRDELIEPALPKGEEVARAYLQDVECLNRQMLEVADRIERDDPDAIVIFQSDHGARFFPTSAGPLAEWGDRELLDYFGVFSAVRAPEACDAGTLEGRSTVNTFRFVLACLRDEPADLVDDRAFLWRDTAPTEVEEIEDAVDRFAAGTSP